MTNRRDFIKQSSAIVAGGLWGGGLLSACRKWQPVRILVKDVFDPLPAGQVQLHGYFDKIINVSCNNWNKGDVPYGETAGFFRTGRQQFALGEMWGKLVRSGSLFYRYTGDAELKTILDAAVADLLSTERPNGSISCVPPEQQPETSDLWERKYVLIGLLDYYDYVEPKPEILESLKRQVDCLITQLGKPPKTSILDVGWSHGGHGKNHIESSTLLEPVVRLYKMTGEKSYLDFAEYIIS
ncbi:MAG: glycoside hydrolase family 127 protein, partial [Tannerellaceae bacterium]|nr:glycoside hydrolase family 127 protein [Tannerellaceae bacterium]